MVQTPNPMLCTLKKKERIEMLPENFHNLLNFLIEFWKIHSTN